MATGRISVALCTHNGERWLAEQLDSLLAQERPVDELVACDDASTDGTWALLQHYAPRFASTRLVRHEAPLGVNRNFESAFRLCSGDWIAPCDQDDLWEPRKLRKLLDASGDRTGLVYGDSAIVDEAGRPTGGRVSHRYTMFSGTDPRPLALANSVSGHASLVRRAVIERALPLPGGVLYDGWLAFVATQCGGVAYVDEPLVRFRQHATNASSFDGRSKARRRESRRESARAQLRHLEALAAFDGAHRPFFERLLELWRTRTEHAFTPTLAGFLYRHRDIAFALKTSPQGRRARHVLKYLRGV